MLGGKRLTGHAPDATHSAGQGWLLRLASGRRLEQRMRDNPN